MITPQPLKTGVKSGRTTNQRSPTLGVGSGPAIASRPNTTGASLPNSPMLYKAPHVRTNITSHANRDNESLRTCSRVASTHATHHGDGTGPTGPYVKMLDCSNTSVLNIQMCLFDIASLVEIFNLKFRHILANAFISDWRPIFSKDVTT